jgi:hypothetical protein
VRRVTNQIPAHELPDLAAKLAALLRQARVTERAHRADILRDAAAIMVEARAQFLTRDGDPDWRGQTHDYRVWFSDAADAAGLSGDARRMILDALRYHTSAALRDRLDAATINELGLRAETARERSAERRVAAAHILSLATGAGPIAADDVADAQALVRHLQRRIDAANDADVARANGAALSAE